MLPFQYGRPKIIKPKLHSPEIKQMITVTSFAIQSCIDIYQGET